MFLSLNCGLKQIELIQSFYQGLKECDQREKEKEEKRVFSVKRIERVQASSPVHRLGSCTRDRGLTTHGGCWVAHAPVGVRSGSTFGMRNPDSAGITLEKPSKKEESKKLPRTS